tara:strand:+ start:868 stop:1338 length:471 start_codon:yes stop_codon:yes gene_type:complete
MSRLILGILLLWSSALWADGPLASKMETYLVAEQSGKEVVTATKDASPGDVIEYRLIYTNQAEQPLSGLEITGPVPANTVYLKDSAVTDVEADFTVSVDDGGSFEAEPITRIQTGADGQSKNVIVPPSDYTQLRWTPVNGIQPGQVQEYRYRVKVQ